MSKVTIRFNDEQADYLRHVFFYEYVCMLEEFYGDAEAVLPKRPWDGLDGDLEKLNAGQARVQTLSRLVGELGFPGHGTDKRELTADTDLLRSFFDDVGDIAWGSATAGGVDTDEVRQWMDFIDYIGGELDALGGQLRKPEGVAS